MCGRELIYLEDPVWWPEDFFIYLYLPLITSTSPSRRFVGNFFYGKTVKARCSHLLDQQFVPFIIRSITPRSSCDCTIKALVIIIITYSNKYRRSGGEWYFMTVVQMTTQMITLIGRNKHVLL